MVIYKLTWHNFFVIHIPIMQVVVSVVYYLCINGKLLLFLYLKMFLSIFFSEIFWIYLYSFLPPTPNGFITKLLDHLGIPAIFV
jgi:hypothetical protein